ncbi:hypothetical protein [Acinetobacter terrestris]|uniref:Nucleotidyltransferase n=1 Tax=Acinetobacter terrestris TaxID=2529843 RepID=A0AAW6UQT3_9GAMM|nr:hypothetical protein [Acinetobacter terrestris]MDK1682641.1 hypothetical protein [Acinetobacter terrestris]
MIKSDLINFIKNHDEMEIYYKYLIGQEVWYFINNAESHSEQYDEFKKFISKKLGVPFNNIAIVGSAKTKFSFSPTKGFKEFCDDSDLDLIIVSKLYYKKLWSAYRKIAQETYLQGFANKTSNVFNGFIGVKDSDETYGNEDLNDWQRLIRTFKADLQLKFNVHHEVNYRIYADWESVQDYHIRGINKLKEGLVKNEVN